MRSVPSWVCCSPRMAMAVVLAASAIMCQVSADAENRSASTVTPVQKVVQLLTDMAAKAKAMKSAEAVEFGKFKQFCIDTTANKNTEVQEGTQLMETLSAEIEKLESDSAVLGKKIAGLQNGVETDQAQIKEADMQREKDRANYREQITDFAESVDALERAIAVLKAQSHDRPQSTSEFLQMLSSSHDLPALPEPARRTVTALLQTRGGDDFLTREAPKAHGYEFQSTSIVDLLEKLRDEFSQKQSDAEKAEANSKHAHGMLSQDLHDAIEGATSDIADKSVVLQERKRLAAESKERLALTTKDRDEAAEYLKSLTSECTEKEKSFEEKQNLRAEEMTAIAKAVEILSSNDVAGAAEAHLPAAAMLQMPASSFAQLGRGVWDAAPQGGEKTRRALASFLHSEGKRIHSRRLSVLAEQVSSSEDPFAKVKKMIDDMITRLLEETNQESEQKGWCDKELGTNGQTRAKLQGTVDALSAKIEEGEAGVTQMSQRISSLAQEAAELSSAAKTASSMRSEEKAKNEETIKDAMEAQQAIATATAILKDFYQGSLSATALFQVNSDRVRQGEPVKMNSVEWDSLANPNFEGQVDPGHREGMQVFGGAAYRGLQAEAGGVLAMLEVIASDFAALQASTTTAEAEADESHKAFMVSTSKSIAVAEKESSMLASDKASAEAELVSLKRDLAANQDQLLAAERYYEKLKPSCVDDGLTFEGRSKARQEEIESLQEALRILSGEGV